MIVSGILLSFIYLTTTAFFIMVGYRQLRRLAVQQTRETLLFERRLDVFNSTVQFVTEVLEEGAASQKQLLAFKGRVMAAYYLFGHDVQDYLDELVNRAARLGDIQARLGALQTAESAAESDFNDLIDQQRRQSQWFSAQYGDALDTFGDYLGVPGRRRFTFTGLITLFLLLFLAAGLAVIGYLAWTNLETVETVLRIGLEIINN